MNNTELRGSIAKWIAEFESFMGLDVPEGRKLVEFLSTRIEDSVFIENDPDIITIVEDGKRQLARIIKEDHDRGIVTMQKLADKTYMTVSYQALSKIAKGPEIVSALDHLKGGDAFPG